MVYAISTIEEALRAISPKIEGRQVAQGNLAVNESGATHSYGFIYKVHDLTTNIHFVLKVAQNQASDVLASFQAEKEAFKNLRGPNIIGFYGFYELPILKNKVPALLLQWADTDLESKIESFGSLVESKMISIVCQVCDALSLMHGKGVYHRDIKTSNVLINNDETIFMSDFGTIGFKRYLGSTTRRGTNANLAPEVLVDDKQIDEYHRLSKTVEAEVYQVGCFIFNTIRGNQLQIFTDVQPTERSGLQKFKKGQKGIAYRDNKINELKCGEETKIIIKRCLDVNPNNRYHSVLDLKNALLKREPSIDNPLYVELETLRQLFSGSKANQYGVLSEKIVDACIQQHERMLTHPSCAQFPQFLERAQSLLEQEADKAYRTLTQQLGDDGELTKRLLAASTGERRKVIKELDKYFRCWGSRYHTDFLEEGQARIPLTNTMAFEEHLKRYFGWTE